MKKPNKYFMQSNKNFKKMKQLFGVYLQYFNATES